MTRSRGLPRAFLTAAVVVGLPLGLGLVLIGICAWTYATTNSNFEHQVAGVMGVLGGIACAPTAIWLLAYVPWMRRRIAAGQKTDVTLGLVMLGLGAAIGLAVTAVFLFVT